MDIRKSIKGRQLGIGPTGELILNKDSGEQQVIGLSVTKVITSAQLLAMFATPQTIIPAQGSGLVAIPRLLQLYKPAGTAYVVDAADDLVLKYTNAAGAQCSSVIETTGFLDQTTAQMRVAGLPGATGTTAGGFAPVDNAAVVLHLLNSEVTTGTGGLVARVWFDLLTTTLPTA